MNARCGLVAVFLFGSGTATARAQSTLLEIAGHAGEQIGGAVAGIGDVNGDGHSDFAVGVPYLIGTTAGEVRLYSGASGELLRILSGPVNSHLGQGVTSIGDLDGDLVPDIAACGDGIGGLHGTVGGMTMIFSGATGAVLISAPWAGASIAPAGDANGDGKPDVLVSHEGINDGIMQFPAARLISGANGSVITTSSPGNSAPGMTLADLGDVDGDGKRDFAMSFPTDFLPPFPSLRVVSGANTGIIATWPGHFFRYGGSLASLGDVNGDGRIDLAVGSLDGYGARVDIISGLGGTTMLTFYGSSGFGASVGNAGDFDGDGKSDVIVGNAAVGEARVFSSATGLELLFLHSDSPGDHLGQSVAGCGDTNLDGAPDVIVGAPNDDDGGTDSGSARVASSLPLPARTYCTAKLNSLGCLPAISSSGVPSASATSGFSVTATPVRNKKPGILLYGVQGSAALAFSGGIQCVASPRRTPLVNSNGSGVGNDCSGLYSLDMNAFAHGVLGGSPDPALLIAGTEVCCQWWGRDPGFAAPNNTTLSNALRADIAP